MTLKEELEILRGEPIEVFTGNPMDIPCIETSEAEQLCKNPVVSVHMLAYNHEPYIRQAIEGVMMQKTDFEFELVIGEDCSKDKTREICFEYQKKHPDKIRVLWWHENMGKVRHPAGDNNKRTMAHCRGEFIAFCEGDDYWIDPLKLQKQVNVMRTYPNVGFCFCGSKKLFQGTGGVEYWDPGSFPKGIMKGETFFNLHLLGGKKYRHEGKEDFIQTATTLVRKSVLARSKEVHKDVHLFKLLLGDTTIWLGLASLSDVYFLTDVVSVYRINAGGVTNRRREGVVRDAFLVRLYYLLHLKLRSPEYCTWFAKRLIPRILSTQSQFSREIQIENYNIMMQDPYFRWLSSSIHSKFFMMLWKNGKISPFLARFLIRYLYFREDTIRRIYLWLKSRFRPYRSNMKS